MLNFIVILLQRHYSTYFDKTKIIGIGRIVIEILTAVWVSDTILKFKNPLDSSMIGSILTAISLFASVLIAILVLLHGQLSQYNFRHDIKIDQTHNNDIPKEMKIDFKRSILIAKIRTTQYLFGNISFCLVIAVLMTILLSLSLILHEHTVLSKYVGIVGIFLLVILLYVVLEIVRRLFYLLDDDFEEVATPTD